MVALPQDEHAHQAGTQGDQRMAGGVLSELNSMEEVGQLVTRMSQAGQDGDVFKLFAEHVAQLIPDLTHISVTLLPSLKPAPQDVTPAKSTAAAQKQFAKNKAAAAPPVTPSRLDWQQYMGGKTGKGAASKKPAVPLDAELLTWPYADLQTGSDMPVLDWRTCKLLDITKENGVKVRHPMPSYPASCTAACHMARNRTECLSTPDYLEAGPHFADWGEMQKQGAVSIASAPLHISNEPVAVLTLASSSPAAFEEENRGKLVWVLAFVLAPYTHLLATVKHQTQAKLFIDTIMPHLLDKALHHDNQVDEEGGSPDEEEDRPGCQHGSSLCAQCQLEHSWGVSAEDFGLERGYSNHNWFTSALPGTTPPWRPYPAPPGQEAADLDLGDFFFNLVSMCIVYAHFSEATLAGESNAAVTFSMFIAAVDIVLLALRWMWCDQFAMHGGRAFGLYRLLVLPFANTWMSWSLFHKLHWQPTSSLLWACAMLTALCFYIGLKVRFFLHVPLQLVTIVLAAGSAPYICSAVQTETGGTACLTIISAVQLLLGLVVPSFLTFLLDFRIGSGYMPHVQPSYWLLSQS